MEFLFPWGWGELEGIANRGDYDLTQHAKHSGEKLDYFDQATASATCPHVIEPAAGATRTMMAFLLAAYDEEEVRGETRTVLRLHPPHRAVQGRGAAAVEEGHAHADGPRGADADCSRSFMCDYDETQAIGRRYRRQDELGTPYCVTVDFDSLEDQAVTVRERDSMEQERVPIDDLVGYLRERLDSRRGHGGPRRVARGEPAAWDERVPLHVGSAFYDNETFVAGRTSLVRSRSTRWVRSKASRCCTCNAISGRTRCRGPGGART